MKHLLIFEVANGQHNNIHDPAAMATTNVQSRCYIHFSVSSGAQTPHTKRGCVGLASEFESKHSITKRDLLQCELNSKAFVKL